MPVTFHEEEHKYTSHLGETYISVTTLIKKYTPPFDADYWSAYKALQAVLSRHGIWDQYKRKAGGWENVVVYVRNVDKDFKYKAEVIKEKKLILQSWEDTKEDALSKGTILHKLKEDGVKEKIVYTPELTEVTVCSDVDILAAQDFDNDGLYPELVLYNDVWGIAGQADWVMKRKKRVDIKDYKTSKEIKREAFRDEKLLGPLCHLPNANYYTYAIQLSLYARMLEERGYEVGTLSIEHIDKNTQKTIGMYPVDYYRKEVDELIKDHVKKRKKH
jgi:hypothetical protein